MNYRTPLIVMAVVAILGSCGAKEKSNPQEELVKEVDEALKTKKYFDCENAQTIEVLHFHEDSIELKFYEDTLLVNFMILGKNPNGEGFGDEKLGFREDGGKAYLDIDHKSSTIGCTPQEN